MHVKQRVTVTDKSDRHHGKTGEITLIRSDGDIEVTGLTGRLVHGLLGPAIYRPDQLRPADS
ncbi:hypothetical protein [Kitasatospora purpeofusca]|uniref:hypothetical protein n=1 Tax=Kitasatospora purpeofusca TaxID=67352 RepID=UPI003817F856